VVGNNVRQAGAGFGHDTNVVTLFDAGGGIEPLAKMSKVAVAHRILDRVRVWLNVRAAGDIPVDAI
jgi:phosphopantothenoylcysteine decarboxylase/phosphopantothenate--cysteine ligase